MVDYLEASAKLNSLPTSPKKVRLVVDIIRNQNLRKGLAILSATSKHASLPISKLLLSAFSNLKEKYGDIDIDEEKTMVSAIAVDGAGFFKRLRTAPQGRAHQIRKRSCHISVVLSFPYEGNTPSDVVATDDSKKD